MIIALLIIRHFGHVYFLILGHVKLRMAQRKRNQILILFILIHRADSLDVSFEFTKAESRLV